MPDTSQILLFSATYPVEVREYAVKMVPNANTISLKVRFRLVHAPQNPSSRRPRRRSRPALGRCLALLHATSRWMLACLFVAVFDTADSARSSP